MSGVVREGSGGIENEKLKIENGPVPRPLISIFNSPFSIFFS
jgi:hypothetical protein